MYVPTCLFLLMLVCTPQPVDADQLHLADTCETLYGYRPYAYTTSYPVFDVGNIGGFVRLPGVANNNVLLNRKGETGGLSTIDVTTGITTCAIPEALFRRSSSATMSWGLGPKLIYRHMCLTVEI